MGIVYWLKQKQIVRRIVHAPLLSIIREWVESAYGRYVFWLSSLGKGEAEGSNPRPKLLLVTVAFNHEGLIRKQIELIRQNVKDTDYKHIIIDNSSDNRKRKAIKAVCEEQGTEYIAVPRYITHFTWNALFLPSYSHGAALNWAYSHVIRPRKPELFVLLDHDILPVKPYDIAQTLGKQDFYGVERTRTCGWYLWPGWTIFRFNAIINRQIDFSPVHITHDYLDTGGRNFLSIFCNYYRSDLHFPSCQTKRIHTTPSLKTHNDIYHGDCIQLIDKAWLHIVNGSNYAHIKGKETMIEKLLEKV